MALPSAKEMYRAVAERDPEYDGVFFVAVRTTRIFCRPTCPARTPLPQNVEYFAAASQALHAGYRPCKRCRPLDRVPGPPQWLRDLVERVDRDPTERLRERDLRAMDLEPARVRRSFKRYFGMTFHAYHRARRIGMALARVREGERVTETAFDHGFESESGFRDAFSRIVGDAPSRSREAGCLVAAWIDTPLGPMLALANDEGLWLLEFVDRRMLEAQLRTIRKRFAGPIVPGEHRYLTQTKAELAEYFEGRRRRFEMPLVLRGTDFQVAAWKALLEIPYGTTRSYSEQAAAAGHAGSQRAIGRANGDNRIAIIVPCHRVVRADGTLCGYGGGLWRKQWLLDLERNSTRAEA
jgi:AraC family transcriptional regulator of adaptative response/methylated-DNA-[protein]-cysteine methyltransferase